jgi:hypothetical protein
VNLGVEVATPRGRGGMSSLAGRGWMRSPLLVVRSAEVAVGQGTDFESVSITATAVRDRVLAGIVDECQRRTAAVSLSIELGAECCCWEVWTGRRNFGEIVWLAKH